MIKNFNTIEEFKKADKNKMLHNAAKAVCKPATDTALQDPADRNTDLGWHQRWLNILRSVALVIIYHSMLRGLEEVPLYILVWLPGSALRPGVETDWSNHTSRAQ
jgi:hypothetical protein